MDVSLHLTSLTDGLGFLDNGRSGLERHRGRNHPLGRASGIGDRSGGFCNAADPNRTRRLVVHRWGGAVHRPDGAARTPALVAHRQGGYASRRGVDANTPGPIARECPGCPA